MAKKHVKAMAIVKMNVLQSAMEVVANGMMGNVGQLLLRIHVQVSRLIVFTTSFFSLQYVISIMDSILKAHEDVVYLRLVRNFAYKSGYDR